MTTKAPVRPKSKKTLKRPRSRKHKEKAYLPNMEPIFNRKVHKAAQHYADCRDTRQAANEEEKAAHDTLLHAMVEAGLEDYEYDGLKVHIDATRKCRVKTEAETAKETAHAETNGEPAE